MSAPSVAAPFDGAMIPLHEVYGVFWDAWLGEPTSGLVFLSAWGRDASIQELVARLALAGESDGIDALRLQAGAEGRVVPVQESALSKRMLRVRAPLFGELVHLFVFHRTAGEPDQANGRALLLDRDPVGDGALWQCVRHLSHLPLLDDWMGPVLQAARERRWVLELEGSGAHGLSVSLDPAAVEAEVSAMVASGRLKG